MEIDTYHFTKEQLSWLQSIGTEKIVEADTTIISEGIAPESFFVVLDGLFSLRFPMLPKDSFYAVGEGTILGEMWFLEDLGPQVSVVALETSKVLAIPYNKVKERIDQDIDFSSRFYEALSIELSSKLRRTSSFIFIPDHKTPDKKVKHKHPSQLTPQGPLKLFTEHGEPNYDKIKEMLRNLEPIESILQKSHSEGLPYPDKAAFEARERALGVATISAEGLSLLFDIMNEVGIKDLDERILCHEGSVKASDKGELLPDIGIQKSVTVKVHNKIGMITGIGDWKVKRPILSSIADSLEISHSAARNFTVNPIEVVPEVEFSLLRGMVSSFIPPRKWTVTSFIGVLIPEVATGSFAISLSPLESLILPQEHFYSILTSYALKAYPHQQIIPIS